MNDNPDAEGTTPILDRNLVRAGEIFDVLRADHPLLADMAKTADGKRHMGATVALSTMNDYLALKRQYPDPKAAKLAAARMANLEYRRYDWMAGAVWLLLAAGIDPMPDLLHQLVPDFFEDDPQDPLDRLTKVTRPAGGGNTTYAYTEATPSTGVIVTSTTVLRTVSAFTVNFILAGCCGSASIR